MKRVLLVGFRRKVFWGVERLHACVEHDVIAWLQFAILVLSDICGERQRLVTDCLMPA